MHLSTGNFGREKITAKQSRIKKVSTHLCFTMITFMSLFKKKKIEKYITTDKIKKDFKVCMLKKGVYFKVKSQ